MRMSVSVAMLALLCQRFNAWCKHIGKQYILNRCCRVPFYGFPNYLNSHTIFDMNTVDLFLLNTQFLTHGIIETGHSLITLLFTFALNHYIIHVVYSNSKRLDVLKRHVRQRVPTFHLTPFRPTPFRPTPFRPTPFRPKLFVQSFSSNLIRLGQDWTKRRWTKMNWTKSRSTLSNAVNLETSRV